MKIIYYEIKNNLHVDIEKIDTKYMNNKTAFLIVNYFGFKSNWSEINKIKEKTGCITIEDNCHITYPQQMKVGNLGSYGDISFNSFRKVLPLLSGSIVINNNSNFSIFCKNSLIPSISQIKYSLRGLRKSSNISKTDIEIPDFNKSGIDFISKFIYSKYSFDYNEIRRKRIKNYEYWENFIVGKGLSKIVDMPNSKKFIPYAFPCTIDADKSSEKWINWGLKNKIVIIKWPNLPDNLKKHSNHQKNVLLLPVNDQNNLTDTILQWA